MAIDYKGSKCQDCELITEYLTVYEFHHKEPGDDDITISRLLRKRQPWNRVQDELDKCVLLCANCHRIRHEIENHRKTYNQNPAA